MPMIKHPALSGLENFSSPFFQNLHSFIPQASQAGTPDVMQGSPWGSWLDIASQGKNLAMRGLEGAAPSPGVTRVNPRVPMTGRTSFYNPLQRGQI